MPGMNGFELGRLARERRPLLPVLYATGYAASYTAPEKGADVLAKPYRESDLLTKLRVLLTASSTAAPPPSALHPVPFANVRHGVERCMPTPGLLQSHTPPANTLLRRAHCASLNVVV